MLASARCLQDPRRLRMSDSFVRDSRVLLHVLCTTQPNVIFRYRFGWDQPSTTCYLLKFYKAAR